LVIDTSSTAPWRELSPRTHSIWQFRSAARGSRACAFVPMMYVDYDLGTDVHNSAPAGRTYRFDLRLVGQPCGPRPDVRSVDVDVSYDDGTTWRPTQTQRIGGRWQVTVDHPATATYVSLRVDAEGTGGAGVTGEIIRAYRLR
jgi:hypothetical protein